MAFSLQQAISERGANQENQFFTNLLQYSIDSSPHFDFTGKTPQLISEGKAMPSKASLWNQYVQLKKGRISPEDLMRFEEMYKHVQNTRSKQQMSKINELSLRNYSDSKIRKMVKDNPIMYQNLIDMIGELKSQGTDEATASAETIKSYLPQKSFLQKKAEWAMENPMMSGPLGAGLAYGGYKAYRNRARLGKWAQSKWQQTTAPKGPGGTPIIDPNTGKPVAGAGGGNAFQRMLKTGPMAKWFGTEIAGMGASTLSGMAGASPETASKIGSAVESGTQIGLGAHGIAKSLASSPNAYGRIAGYGALGLLGLYNLFASE